MKIGLSTIAGGAAAMLAPTTTTASGASIPSNNVKENLHNNRLRHNNRIKTLNADQNEVKEEGHVLQLVQTLGGSSSSSSCVTVTSYDESAKTVTVDVRQCLLGRCDGTAGDMSAATSDSKNADLFLVTYKKKDGSSACGFQEKRADACFVEAIENIPCDPITNMATLTLYTRDKKMLQKSDIVENPKLGKCRLGKGKRARNTIQKEEIVECAALLSPAGVNPPVTCSYTDDNCGEGEYCNFHYERGYECKAYVNVGDYCGGFTILGEQNVCDPSISFCYYADSCFIADAPGTCEAYASLPGETCKTDAECDTVKGEWCDVELGKCKFGLQEGACCDALQDNCDVDLMCALSERGVAVCQSENGPAGTINSPPGTINSPPGTCSDTYNNCPKGEYCNAHWERGFECKAYVNVGDLCGGFTMKGNDNRCDPSESFCYLPDACYSGLADVPGTCEALASLGDDTCTTSSDCNTATGEWCDVYLGKCKFGIQEGACCNAKLQNCDIGYTCKSKVFDRRTTDVCQPI